MIDADERDRLHAGQRGTLPLGVEQGLPPETLCTVAAQCHHVTAGINATLFFLIGLLAELVPRRYIRSSNSAGHVPASIVSSVMSVPASACDTGQFAFAASACFANVA